MDTYITTFFSIIGTYGLCHLLVYEDGAYDTLLKIRRVIKPFRCMPCSVAWVAIPVSIYFGIGLLGYIAIIGGVIFMDKINTL